MENSLNKSELKISVIVGILAGALSIPTLLNLSILPGFGWVLAIAIGLAIATPIGYLVAFFLSRWFSIMLQIVKFGIVGGLNTMVDLGILNTLIWFTGLASGTPFVIFKTLSFSVAVTSSYFWNKYWTFNSYSERSANEFTKFILVNLVGLGINVGGASFLVNVIGPQWGLSRTGWPTVATVLSIGISLVWNFIGMKFLIFKK